MTEVPLPINWSFDVAEFTKWANSEGQGEWNFRTTSLIFCPRLEFEREEDALAFKLKFL